MKKILAAGLIIAALLIGMKHKKYAIVGIIKAVDLKSDTITFVDNYGHMWDMSGCEDYNTGDHIAIVMDDNGTEDYRNDDVIISARYID